MLTESMCDPQALAAAWGCGVDVYSDQADWLIGRRRVIGASDTAGILGLGYADQSPLTVWESKVRPVARGDFDKRLSIGKLIEPALRSIFTSETGLECHAPGDTAIFVSAVLPWLGATLDGVCYDDDRGNCPCELKNVSAFNRDEWADEPPLKYLIQVQHQLAVTGACRGYLLGLIGGNEPIVRVVERNDRFIDAMVSQLAKFWQCVESQTLPEIDGNEASGEVLARLYPSDSGDTVCLPTEADELDRRLVAAKAIIKEAEAEKTACENQLKALIGEASIGLLPSGGSYSWKLQERKGYVVQPASFRVMRRSK